MKQILFFLILSTFLIACTAKPNTDSEVAESESEAVKPVAELTYYDLWSLILKTNDAGGIDVHGEEYGTAGVESLSFEFQGDCDGCGERVLLTSTSSDTLRAIVEFTFDLPGNPMKEMQREYVIPPNESFSVGCANFCYDGETYAISRSIISAGTSAIN